MNRLSNFFLAILLILLLGHFYIPPLYPNCWHSRSIAQSKEIKAFVCECRIINIDTLQNSYPFPNIRSIWVEYTWDKKRNKWGIIRPVANLGSSKTIAFELISTDDTFYSRTHSLWEIREYSKRLACARNNSLYHVYGNYNKGDTISFEIYRPTSRKTKREEDMILYRFTVCCDK